MWKPANGRGRLFSMIAVTSLAASGLAMPAFAAENVTYEYDALGRLVKTQKSGGPATGITVHTSFDPAGNRANQTVSGVNGVVVNLPQPNRTPVAINDAASFLCYATGRIVYPLTNDSDPDGHSLSITGVTRTGGSALASSWNATSVTFNMNNFRGSSTFDYTISDGNGGTANAVITLTGTGAARAC